MSKLATKDELSHKLLQESHVVFEVIEDIYMPKSMKIKPRYATKDQLLSCLVMVDHLKQILKIKDHEKSKQKTNGRDS